MFEFNNRACKSCLKLFKSKNWSWLSWGFTNAQLGGASISEDWVGGLGAEKLNYNYNYIQLQFDLISFRLTWEI